MRKKIKRKFIQKTLFDDDEVFVATKSSKSMKYSPYIKGAVDMFIQFLRTQNEVSGSLYEDGQAKIIHLPRKYMESFVTKALKERQFLWDFLYGGGKVKFSLDRDSFGDVKNINVSYKYAVLHKEKEERAV